MAIERLLHSLQSQYLALSNRLVDLQHKTSVAHTARSAFDPAIFAEYWQLCGCRS
jgi:hypothetical protein